jgi:hypothetical protein
LSQEIDDPIQLERIVVDLPKHWPEFWDKLGLECRFTGRGEIDGIRRDRELPL